MVLKYDNARDIKQLVDEIVARLDFYHIVPQFVFCFRSTGSQAHQTIARIYGLGRIWQEALLLPPAYAIEVISERFDKLSQKEKEEVLIHELLHIPKKFTGGFRPHKGYINTKIVDKYHLILKKQRINKKKILKTI